MPLKKKNVYKVHGSTAADFPGGVREKKKSQRGNIRGMSRSLPGEDGKV